MPVKPSLSPSLSLSLCFLKNQQHPSIFLMRESESANRATFCPLFFLYCSWNCCCFVIIISISFFFLSLSLSLLPFFPLYSCFFILLILLLLHHHLFYDNNFFSLIPQKQCRIHTCWERILIFSLFLPLSLSLSPFLFISFSLFLCFFLCKTKKKTSTKNILKKVKYKQQKKSYILIGERGERKQQK